MEPRSGNEDGTGLSLTEEVSPGESGDLGHVLAIPLETEGS